MNRSLIVSQADKTAETIEQILKAEGFSKTAFVSGGSEARRYLNNDMSPDIMIINSPLSDESGHELAIMASSLVSAGVILIVSGNIADETADRLSGSGIYIISRPLNRKQFSDTVREIIAGTSKEKEESPDLMNRIEEMRFINKAKRTLIEYLGFTEPQAHRYIEKQAMNNRQTRREVAEKIISAYEK